MSEFRTTSCDILNESIPEFTTIYAPDGSPHTCTPADAREILSAGLGYTAEPAILSADEQQPEQQFQFGGEASERNENEENETQTGEESLEKADVLIAPRRSRSKRA